MHPAHLYTIPDAMPSTLSHSYPLSGQQQSKSLSQQNQLKQQSQLKQQNMMPLLSALEDPFPSLAGDSTLPSPINYASMEAKSTKSTHVSHRVDPYHLAPEDAFCTSASPPRHSSNGNPGSGSELLDPRPSRQSLRLASAIGGSGVARATGVMGAGSRSRSRRRRKRTWKKLLWVKQSCKSDVL